jgi:hypothetical protein
LHFKFVFVFLSFPLESKAQPQNAQFNPPPKKKQDPILRSRVPAPAQQNLQRRE